MTVKHVTVIFFTCIKFLFPSVANTVDTLALVSINCSLLLLVDGYKKCLLTMQGFLSKATYRIMRACAHVCVYVCVYVGMYVCMCVCMYVG